MVMESVNGNIRRKPVKRVICFDLWGTLITSTWGGPSYEDELVRNESRYLEPRDRALIQAAVRGRFMTHDAHNERGLDLECNLLGKFDYLPYSWCASMMVGSGLAADEITRRWQGENLAAEWLPSAQDALRVLKPFGELVLVTNTTEAGWQTVNKKLHLTHHQRFGRNVVLSCDLPVAKPDPYLWQKVQSDHPADEYWMIGNDPVFDIAVPAAMGWRTILVNHQNGVPITDVPRIVAEAK